MPRTARASLADFCYHTMSRGNAGAVIFHDHADYRRFRGLVIRANERLPMRVLAWCLMPNHFHIVLQPHADGDLGRWMQWLLTSHVQAHRARHKTVGRIWQGRFKSPPIQQDDHLLTVLRYVERNALRAGLVDRAERWPWSSAHARVRREGELPHCSPVPLPANWIGFVNTPLTPSELAAVRTSVSRQRPYGDEAWTRGTAERLGLTASLGRRGRRRSDVR